MSLAFVAVRSTLYASAFFWLWAWLALGVRRYDARLGGPLPEGAGALAYLLLPIGGAVAAWCIGAFVVRGRGTPAPFDAPRRLVVAGPYRYVRNPMYVGGALLLAGLGFQQRSPSIVLFAASWWLLFHLFVVLYEEPALEATFGPDYVDYCRRTPRWLPRWTVPVALAVSALSVAAAPLGGDDRKPDFSGEWRLDVGRSEFGPIAGPDRRTDRIEHAEHALRMTSRQARGDRESHGQWDCRTDGSRCAVSLRGSSLQVTTRVSWDGPVLVFESEGTWQGSQVRMEDRWTLSPDGREITVLRRMSNEMGEAHQRVVLERQTPADDAAP